MFSLQSKLWYIGSTRWNIYKRYQKHVNETIRLGQDRDKKYLKIKKEGIHNFVMLAIQYADAWNYKAIESKLIDLLRPPLNSDRYIDFSGKRKIFDNQKR